MIIRILLSATKCLALAILSVFWSTFSLAVENAESVSAQDISKYDSILQIQMLGNGVSFFGSAFHIGDGYIATAFHNIGLGVPIDSIIVRDLSGNFIDAIDMKLTPIEEPDFVSSQKDSNGLVFKRPDIVILKAPEPLRSKLRSRPALKISVEPTPKEIPLYVVARVPYTSGPKKGTFMAIDLDEQVYDSYGLNPELDLMVPYEEKLTGFSKLVQSNSGAPLFYEDAKGQLTAVGIVSLAEVVRANPLDKSSPIIGQWNIFSRFNSKPLKSFFARLNFSAVQTGGSVIKEEPSINKKQGEHKKDGTANPDSKATIKPTTRIDVLIAYDSIKKHYSFSNSTWSRIFYQVTDETLNAENIFQQIKIILESDSSIPAYAAANYLEQLKKVSIQQANPGINLNFVASEPETNNWAAKCDSIFNSKL